jgi:hypothetical protein
VDGGHRDPAVVAELAAGDLGERAGAVEVEASARAVADQAVGEVHVGSLDLDPAPAAATGEADLQVAQHAGVGVRQEPDLLPLSRCAQRGAVAVGVAAGAVVLDRREDRAGAGRAVHQQRAVDGQVVAAVAADVELDDRALLDGQGRAGRDRDRRDDAVDDTLQQRSAGSVEDVAAEADRLRGGVARDERQEGEREKGDGPVGGGGRGG